MLSVIQILIAMHGVWSAWDYNTDNWSELAPLLASNGFDTVFYCTAYGPETDIEGLRKCWEACSEYDIDVHAWVVMWKSSRSPDSLVQSLDRQNRLQVSIDDDLTANSWLCPSSPENVELFASLCMKIVREVPVTGVHLDYIRYSSDRVCFCQGCCDRFSRQLGQVRFSWPEDCYRGGSLHDEFNLWRAGTITQTVRAVRDSLSRINRVTILSAAVLPEEREMDYFAQHWDIWIEDGLLDFVVPMNYSLSDSAITYWSRYQLGAAGDVPICCGLINYQNGYVFLPDELKQQQALAEDLGFDGWVLFHLSNNTVDMLKDSVFVRPGRL